MPADIDDPKGLSEALVNAFITFVVNTARADKEFALKVLSSIEGDIETETLFRLRSDQDREMVLAVFKAARVAIDKHTK